ncbi:alkaline phosphatase D family protein [Altererythrobacter sp. CAU 1778]
MKNDPPANPVSHVQVDRRSLLRASILGSAIAATPLSARVVGQRGFTHGVASGEPRANSVLLWTRYLADRDTQLEVEVSETLDFFSHTRGQTVTASPANDCCAKAVVTDLKADSWYYFRFVAPDGTQSPVGRTRTLPEGPVAEWKMAVFSCSNLGFGWFNAYAHAAESNAFDCVLHLGDYIYEYQPGNYPTDDQTVAGRLIDPARETVALTDYRLRYAAYRSDPDLQRLHQMYPMISGWDDHESTNDSWKGGAQNHQPESEGSWDVRKAAASKAYREWMPVSDDPWTSYEIGDLATIYRVETRLTGRDEQPDMAAALRAGDAAQIQAALTAFKDGVWRDPARQMMGETQERWLFDDLKRSRGSGTTWQVFAQQTIMMSLALPKDVADGLTDAQPEYVRQRIRAAAAASGVGLPFNMDAWDGYPAARDRLLRAALNADANMISLAGDSHNAWAGSLDIEGELAAVEFAGHSVTSPGVENSLPWIAPADFERKAVERNRQLMWADTSRRGYMAVTLTPDVAVSEFRFLNTVRQRSTRLAGTHRISAPVGQRSLLPA